MLTIGQKDFIINHVFLPPKLPGCCDDDEEAMALLNEVRAAIEKFSHLVPNESRYSWEKIAKSVSKWIDVYNDGQACEHDIETAISGMEEDESLLLYIKHQNAAILLRKTASRTIFDTFEVQLDTKSVLDAQAALVRSFPAKSVSVADTSLQRPTFLRELVSYIHKLTTEKMGLSMTKSKKGGTEHVEDRESAHPKLVTAWLFGSLLASEGEPSDSTPTIVKHTHDEVIFENVHKPWRRSPIWSCVKVAVQLSLRHLLSEDGNIQYKNFLLFFVSTVATQVTSSRTDLDLLHVTRAKVARRHAKLADNTYGFVQDVVTTHIRRTTSRMQQAWGTITDRERGEVGRISCNQYTDGFVLGATFERLLNIYDKTHSPCLDPAETFQPMRVLRPSIDRGTIPTFASVHGNDGEEHISLLVIEQWVATCLTPELEQLFKSTSSNCSKIRLLLIDYHAVATRQYKDHPRQLSVMLLTVMELWMALDKMVTSLHPLLKEYSPEIPLDLFAPLLLHKRHELERLSRLEIYLSYRHCTHKPKYTSIFGKIDTHGFGPRFYKTSTALQDLKVQIETQAEEERESHTARFRELQGQRTALLAEYGLSVCDKYTIPRGRRRGQTTHCKYCVRCRKKREADNLSIGKHEWPLPRDATLAEAAVFELQPPEAFVAWRDATWFILEDIAQTGARGNTIPEGYLLRYEKLRPYVHLRDRRVAFASSVKSMDRAHYRIQVLGVDTIFVDHCMKYELHDAGRGGWTARGERKYSLSTYCLTKLDSSVPSLMSQAVNSVTHTQNLFIANQLNAPLELATQEFVRVGSLRSGSRLQWMNLLTDLRSCQVNFNNEVMVALVEQLSCQVGHGSEVSDEAPVRDAHVDFLDSGICDTLSKVVQEKIESVQANWKETDTAAVLLLVANRLLGLSVSSDQTERALNMIRQLRGTCLQWSREMARVCFQIQSEDADIHDLGKIRSRMLSTALLTRSMWDLDRVHMLQMFGQQEDLADFIECSVQIYEASSQIGTIKNLRLRNALLTDKVLAASLENVLSQLIAKHGDQVSAGVLRVIPDSTIHESWRLTTVRDGVWIESTIGEHATKIQFNLASGCLLVGGKPISLLPKEYTQSEVYKAVFGSRVLSVTLSDIPNMPHKTAQTFSNQAIYFSMRAGNLIIQSSRQGRRYEIVPNSAFGTDIPPLLIADTIAWRCLDSGHIEFRNRKQLWEPTSTMVILEFKASSRHASVLRQGTKLFISRNSDLGTSISSAFRNFEKPEYLHITRDCKSGEIEVRLPRFQLNFSVNESEQLQCREFSSVIAPVQSIQTLHGLDSRLVLQSVGRSSSRLEETVLVPRGGILIARHDLHVRISIDTDNTPKAKYFLYKVDRRLGQLLSSGDLEAQFFKAYLHAITSSPLTDQLTSRTGTEESLLCLSDPITKTTVPLSAASQKYLSLLAELTPVRTFYPEHLKVMQRIKWHKVLSPLSQHNAFYGTVQEILTHNGNSSHFLMSVRSAIQSIVVAWVY